MDIQKFNEELAKRVNKAHYHEKSNNIKEAIASWVSIADLVLKVSKTPNLPFSYKSMLIKKSEQILEHIKVLKRKIELKQSKKIETPKEIEPNIQDVKTPAKVEKMAKSPAPISEEKEQKFEDIPEGFTEIEATKDFKIITPHDEAYLDKLLSMDHDNINLDDNSGVKFISRNENKSFCFACGAEILSNSKLCPQCGTKLE